jgi:hypothetical protein
MKSGEQSINAFEKWQAGTCFFSKEVLANPGNVSANSKKGIKILKTIVHAQKSFANSKAFDVYRLTSY